MHLGTIARNVALLCLIGCATGHLAGQERSTIPMSQHVLYRTAQVDGLAMFYREVGPQDAPTMLLLHVWTSTRNGKHGCAGSSRAC